MPLKADEMVTFMLVDFAAINNCSEERELAPLADSEVARSGYGTAVFY